MFSCCAVVLFLWILSFLEYRSVAAIRVHNHEYSEKSKLILFQGPKRFVLDGKDCPVGITFVKPERFSCACVTGLFAFYDEWCAPPVKVIGGVDHCFLMPPLWFQQIMIWSNPIRGLDTTLAAFDGDEVHVKLKVYRNTHTALRNTSSFVANNSSWTLLGADGAKICLDSNTENKNFPNEHRSISLRTSQFCHFSQVHQYIPEISTFKPGCKGKLRELKPYKCQNYEDPNDEYTCTQPEVLANFDRLQMISNVVPRFRTRSSSLASKTSESSLPVKVPRAEKENLQQRNEELSEDEQLSQAPEEEASARDKKWTEVAEIDASEPKLRTKETENPYFFNASRENFDDGKLESDGGSTSGTKQIKVKLVQIFIDFPPEDSEIEQSNSNGDEGDVDDQRKTEETVSEVEGTNSEAEVTVSDTEETVFEAEETVPEAEETFDEQSQGTYLTEENFLDFGTDKSLSNPVIVSNLFTYKEEMILTLLNLKRQDDLDSVTPTQIFQLLNISTLIMQRTCSLVPPEFFNMSLQIFLNVQQKYINWDPPFISNFQFQRIRHSLHKCLGRAQPFVFQRHSECSVQPPRSVFLNGIEEPLTLDPVFKSAGFEPIIESVWKTVANAHSYCYSDFSQFYNDHHQYTTLLAAIFTNGIYSLWFRNSTLHVEYNGIVGNVHALLDGMERCIAASRLVSAYPWNLSRPHLQQNVDKQMKFSKRRRRDLRSKKIRVQLPGTLHPVTPSRMPVPVIKFPRTKRPESRRVAGSSDDDEAGFISPDVGEDLEWKYSRSVLNGLAFCLKKFDEPKVKLGQTCR